LQKRLPGFKPNDWKDEFRGAFETATETWAKESLPVLVGKNRSREVLDLLNKEMTQQNSH
ncbi:hypothetical protein, partial [Bradyrhizobium sp. STM 3809]|uniref:hypothetical protein n=1 Tax=Bradyrhizobium sp. STM 3809 TaxID=551936 RepID=UPI000550F74A